VNSLGHQDAAQVGMTVEADPVLCHRLSRYSRRHRSRASTLRERSKAVHAASVFTKKAVTVVLLTRQVVKSRRSGFEASGNAIVGRVNSAACRTRSLIYETPVREKLGGGDTPVRLFVAKSGR